MLNSIRIFFRKINPLVFTVVIVLLGISQSILKKMLMASSAENVTHLKYINLCIHLLFDICLLGLFIRRYNADNIRVLLMFFFLLELTAGIFLKELLFSFSRELIAIGFIGILITWFNTHMNRKKFIQEEN